MPKKSPKYSDETKDTKYTTTEAEVVSAVTSDFQKAYRAKQAKERLFQEVYRRYRSYLEVSRQTTRSTLFIPEAFTLVETVAPRMTARKPAFRAVPRQSAAITKADSVGKLLEHRYDVMGLHPKIKTFDKQRLIYGTTFMKMGWDAVNKRPMAAPVDIADIFGDPETDTWQEGYIIHRYYRQVDELKRSKVKYKNLDALEARTSTNKRDDQMRQDRLSIQSVPYENNRSGTEILEWWGWVDGKIRVRAVADRSICIRDDNNPNPLEKPPFVVAFDQEVPFEKWGIGEIEPILDLQDEENTIRNQRIDEKNLSIHNMWVVSKLAGVDYRNLVSKPGGIILANDINGVKPLEKQNITQDSIAELNLIKDDIRNATGVNDYVRGTGSGANTATEVISKTQEANQRFAEKINNLEMALKEIGEWIVALDAAFLTEDIRIRITGKYGLQEEVVTLEDIRAGYDIDIESGSSLPANPDLRRQQLRELTQVIAPHLTNPNGIPEGMRELLRTVIQAYDLKNTDEILQGARHPNVNQVLANLRPEEMQGMNPKMVEAEVERMLMGSGMLQPIPEPGAAAPAAGIPGTSTESTKVPAPDTL